MLAWHVNYAGQSMKNGVLNAAIETQFNENTIVQYTGK